MWNAPNHDRVWWYRSLVSTLENLDKLAIADG
jgi:hypothetical protein